MMLPHFADRSMRDMAKNILALANRGLDPMPCSGVLTARVPDRPCSSWVLRDRAPA